jgi:hypothetical protein
MRILIADFNFWQGGLKIEKGRKQGDRCVFPANDKKKRGTKQWFWENI